MTKKIKSKYKGVHFCNTRKKWIATIKRKGMIKHVGVFISEEDAYQKRQKELTSYDKIWKYI